MIRADERARFEQILAEYVRKKSAGIEVHVTLHNHGVSCLVSMKPRARRARQLTFREKWVKEVVRGGNMVDEVGVPVDSALDHFAVPHVREEKH